MTRRSGVGLVRAALLTLTALVPAGPVGLAPGVVKAFLPVTVT
jgi:hypothetical protein